MTAVSRTHEFEHFASATKRPHTDEKHNNCGVAGNTPKPWHKWNVGETLSEIAR
ncbi:TPA: hypothetical protein OUI11_003400 [Acinetobacter baumannii]|nr:hypothetical protein [Acinetobacter baumannii]